MLTGKKLPFLFCLVFCTFSGCESIDPSLSPTPSSTPSSTIHHSDGMENDPSLSPTPSSTPGDMIRHSDGMEMVFVPGGTFILAERGISGRGAHSVTLYNYWIDKTEITNHQYSLCVEAGVCRAPTTCTWGDPTYDLDSHQNHPVICVTRKMASTYCSWAGGRLPTDAEWDFAARGPERSLFPWGDEFDPAKLNFCDASCSHIGDQYNDYNDEYPKTSPAGNYPNGASWCGAMDMAGNVWEWISDWYELYTGEDQINPTGPHSGSEGLIRGGSWYDNPEFNQSDHRHPYDPRDYNHLIGFRCVVSNIELEQ